MEDAYGGLMDALCAIEMAIYLEANGDVAGIAIEARKAITALLEVESALHITA